MKAVVRIYTEGTYNGNNNRNPSTDTTVTFGQIE